ncbi:MAG: YihY/virulence factor BrkB family protein [Lachnospiraceae bacterium]|jgi:membrane protein|nr:YihY/virulence factor BrkB family protein [Lachnospiraceae bacterium]
MIEFLLYAIRLKEKYTEDEISVYAAQASFFILLSAFPFIMVLLTVIQLIPTVSKSDLLSILVSLMPEMLKSTTVSIIDDLFTKSPGKILSITALLAIWSASKGMLSMNRGFNRIFGCKGRRGYFRSRFICTGYTILFIVACIMSLVLLVFGSTLQNLILNVFPVLGRITFYIISFRTLLSLSILTIIFAGLYTFIPDKKQKLKFQLPGAVFSTLCWIGFSFAFSVYFNNFSNYSYMYGSLTAMVLLMLWLYFCICILFFGAEINYFYEKKRAVTDAKD